MQMEISFMWGIYLDIKAFEDGLFQAVVQYKIDNGKALVMLPKPNYELDMKRIRVASTSPVYLWGTSLAL